MEKKQIEEILKVVKNGTCCSIQELEEELKIDIEKIFENHIQERRKLNIYIRDNQRKSRIH